jgi:hypothetical protein
MEGAKKRGRPRVDRPLPVDFDDGPLPPSPIDGLLSSTRRRLLRLLYGEPERAYCVRELRDLTRCGAGAAQRELHRLARAGLITATVRGNRVMLQANLQSPIHAQLVEIVRKTIGMVAPIREAFAALDWRIDAAYVFEPERDPEDRHSRGLGMIVLAENLDASDLLIARDLAEHLLQRPLWIAERRPEARESDDFVRQVLRQPGAWVF